MSKLDFATLPRYRERKFVPGDACLTEKDQLVALYQKLLAREISSAVDLEGWLMDISELGAAVDQETHGRLFAGGTGQLAFDVGDSHRGLLEISSAAALTMPPAGRDAHPMPS